MIKMTHYSRKEGDGTSKRHPQQPCSRRHMNSLSSPGTSQELRGPPPTLTVLPNDLGEKERVTWMEIYITAFVTQT
jgi:hypothetical protein